MIQNILLLVLLFSFSACGLIFPGVKNFSQAEIESGYTYVPIDPLPVFAKPGKSCKNLELSSVTLLQSLPDNAVRMLVEQFDATGKVTYGPSNLGGTVGSYRVTIDYINADTINQKVWISKSVLEDTSDYSIQARLFGEKSPKVKPERALVPLLSTPDFRYFPGSEVYSVTKIEPVTKIDPKTNVQSDAAPREFNIPVYVGIGLRIAANIEVFDSKANISGLGVIGAEAEANRLKGSLVVQTLGVNGKSIAAALPLQSELNRTTTQNAIVAVGSIKALLYSDDTALSPRVVGLYLPFPGGKSLVNALISELSKEAIPWTSTCPVPVPVQPPQK